VKAWAAYSALALLVGVVGVVLALIASTGDTVRAVVFSAVLAWGIQAVAFAALVQVSARPDRFMIAWLGGIVLRFAAVGAVAFWVTRSGALPPSATLVSLVAFIFVMLMLEPLFMRKGRQTG
jgi:phosphoglycerol transferase MdoB-like AlkP superfamily enzyme